jgi:hypothetical protein
MWNRACPLCFGKVPRSLILVLGDELACPSCHASLQLSRASRVAGAFGGLFCTFLAGHVMHTASGGDWALPVVGSIVAYGLGSALILYFLSDLVVQPKPPLSHFPQAHK